MLAVAQQPESRDDVLMKMDIHLRRHRSSRWFLFVRGFYFRPTLWRINNLLYLKECEQILASDVGILWEYWHDYSSSMLTWRAINSEAVNRKRVAEYAVVKLLLHAWRKTVQSNQIIFVLIVGWESKRTGCLLEGTGLNTATAGHRKRQLCSCSKM